jgi:hypothetical protein
VVTPPSVLIEVARTSDLVLRSELVHAVASRGKIRIHPRTEAKMLADEVIEEMRLLRPEWVWKMPETSNIARLEKFWELKIWQSATRDPVQFGHTILDSDMEAADTAIYEVQAENKQAASASGFRLRDSEPWTNLSDQPTSVQLGWNGQPFHLWRLKAAQLWWDVIVVRPSGTPGHPSLRDWLAPYLKRQAVREDRERWNRLWYHEVEASRMPRTWMTEVLFDAQLQQKLSFGNSRDVQHAAYLFDADVFFTADGAYATALENVSRWTPKPFAVVRRVPSPETGSTVDAIAALLSS